MSELLAAAEPISDDRLVSGSRPSAGLADAQPAPSDGATRPEAVAADASHATRRVATSFGVTPAAEMRRPLDCDETVAEALPISEAAVPAADDAISISVLSSGDAGRAPSRGDAPSTERLVLPEPAGETARALARELRKTVTLADLLLRRGHAEPEAARQFLDPRLANLTRPDQMADRRAACERLADAVRRRERIAVFGDYDCDGITSAAIMTSALRAFGAEVVPLVASRYDGGYGLSARAVEKVIDTACTVLVTCDCGSSDHESLSVLTARGVDAIVIDHHLIPPEPLPVLAFLNPHRKECGFPYKGLASCGLALSVAAGIRTALGATMDLRTLLDLVAIGTIGDAAPLDGDNRALVRAGLRALAEAHRPGVRALLELARVDVGAPISGEDVAFRLAPRLNAPGRLGSPEPALRLLLERDIDAARLIAAEIEQISNERRALQETMLREAVAEIDRECYAERASIVIGREGWSPGVVGIVAGRLADRYERPVIVIGFENGVGRGSVRGPEGSHLYTAVSATASVLVRYGGHESAAGLEIELARLCELREAFDSACAAGLAARGVVADGCVAPRGRRPELVWLDPDDDPGRVLADLALLEPCGERNPAARVAIDAGIVAAREVRGGHLKLELELTRGRRIAAFGPGLGARAGELQGRAVVVGRLRPDRWRGGSAVEVKIDAIP